jgi:stage V sporulation protein D (sporulation-specific penicillin-binding protein)
VVSLDRRIDSSRRRLLFLHILVSVFLFIMALRLGWLQIVEGEKYQAIANRQHTSDLTVPSKRGTIYDRNGKELAITTVKSRIWANPYLIDSPDEAAEKLAPLLGIDKEKLLEPLNRENTTLVSLARRVDDVTVEAIKEMDIRGIWFVDDNERVYPYGNFAVFVMGHTTDDGRGIAGVEQRYEKELAGIAGRSIVNIDGARRQLPFHVEKHFSPVNGVNLILTIDEVIQHYTEKAVTNALEKHDAERVIAIVMEVKTGEILSMGIKPDYDPNHPRTPLRENEQEYVKSLPQEDQMNYWFTMWRNPVFQEIYEPGSVFKVITAAAALEEHVTTPATTFNSTGTIEVAGTTIRSWRWYNPFGEQTFKEAVQNSDNPVFVQVAQNMGKETFYKYLYAIGISGPTGVDYPGEIGAFMYSLPQVGPVELATISFGQGISVTPIQMLVSAVATINGGYVIRPRLVREMRHENGDLVQRFEPVVVRQAISAETSRQMRDILESVVAEGSGSHAGVTGYRIGGKTGTAQKVVAGGYESGKYIASFFGFFPADDPELAVLVLIDEPKGKQYYGGEIAAPVAGEIFSEVIRYLDYKPAYQEQDAAATSVMEVVVPEIRDLTVMEGKQLLLENYLNSQLETQSSQGDLAIIVDTFPKPGTTVPAYSNVLLYTGYDTSMSSLVMVPDLTGKTIREVNTILSARELTLKITGSGLAKEQVPEPGTLLEPGSLVNVHFGP